MTEVTRNFLEIYSLLDLKEGRQPSNDYYVILQDPVNFQLNKFLYKKIGCKHKWVDRLIWSDQQWINYVSSDNVKTYILKYKNDLIGFFELIHHRDKKEVELAYLGILEEYQNNQLGSYLLSEAIKESFKNKIKRVWAHTCTLDHKNALNNYITRGMKIFKTEIVNI